MVFLVPLDILCLAKVLDPRLNKFWERSGESITKDRLTNVMSPYNFHYLGTTRVGPQYPVIIEAWTLKTSTLSECFRTEEVHNRVDQVCAACWMARESTCPSLDGASENLLLWIIQVFRCYIDFQNSETSRNMGTALKRLLRMSGCSSALERPDGDLKQTSYVPQYSQQEKRCQYIALSSTGKVCKQIGKPGMIHPIILHGLENLDILIDLLALAVSYKLKGFFAFDNADWKCEARTAKCFESMFLWGKSWTENLDLFADPDAKEKYQRIEWDCSIIRHSRTPCNYGFAPL